MAQAVSPTPIDRMGVVFEKIAESYALDLERAAIVLSPAKGRQYVASIVFAIVVSWALMLLVWHPDLVTALFWLVALAGVAVIGVRYWIYRRIKKRLAAFRDQLEMVLRLIVSALRVGLGLRQAIAMVINDMPSPANVEFGRALAQTTIGVTVEDALDQLAARMPSTEMSMFAKAIAIQSRTGGNLAKILLNLAEMIKQRRRIDRRIRSLTAESRSTKWVITALPVVVTTFILLFEPEMRDGLLGTFIGHCVLVLAAILVISGWIIFDRISRLDV
jgi:Flp pilus assembly protein TadB